VKRTAALILVLALCLGFSACTAREPEPLPKALTLEEALADLAKETPEGVYAGEYLPAGLEKEETLLSLSLAGGRVYLTTRREDSVRLLRLEQAGTLKTQRSWLCVSDYDEAACRSTDSLVDLVTVAPDATIWYIRRDSRCDWSDPDRYLRQDHRWLVREDARGKVLQTAALPEGEPEPIALFFPPEGDMLALGETGCMRLSLDGELRSRADYPPSMQLSRAVMTESGRVAGLFLRFGSDGKPERWVLGELQPASGGLRELETLPADSTEEPCMLLAGAGDSLLIPDDRGLRRLDLETGDWEKTLDWLSSGVDPFCRADMLAMGESSLLLVLREPEGSLRLMLLRPEEEPEARYLIRLSLPRLTPALAECLLEYNRRQELCRVVLTDEDADVFDPREDTAARMDLSPVLAELPVVISVPAAAMKDRTRLCLSFGLRTAAAAESRVGDTPGWTAEQLRSLLERSPGTALLPEGGAEEALEALYAPAYARRKDTAEREESVRRGLELLRELLEGLPERQKAEGPFAAWREVRTFLLLPCTLYRCGDLPELDRRLGERVCLIGLPELPGSGAVLEPVLELAVDAASDRAAACMDLLGFLLGDWAQEKLGQEAFPVRRDVLAAREAGELPPEDAGRLEAALTGAGT
jgi:hypothetical protein